MIFDKLGLPRDNGATDKQDSARLAGILATFDWPQKANNIYLYLKEKTYVRHPEERVYDFSRDQAIPLMAGLNALGYHDKIKAFFRERAKDFFFCQNIERDVPGSRKSLFSSKPDYADPLFFNHLGALILGGRIRALYLLVPFCLLVHLLMIVLHKFSGHFEENQIIAECSMYGTLKVYKCIHSGWEQVSMKYWSDRAEVEYHYMLKEFVDGNG